MAQELNEIDQQLATEIKWKSPRYPFVAFRARKCEVLKDGDRQTPLEEETGLRAYDTIVDLTVRGVHRQKEKLSVLMKNKRWKVAAWGNFPPPDSEEAKATKGSARDPDDWSVLDQWLRSEYSGQLTRDKEVRGMEAKVKDLEAKLAKQEKAK